jgi:hypothetical protein
VLTGSLISVCLIGPLGRQLVLGLVLLIFFASQARSLLDTYRNTTLYQRRQTMALSDLQILENLYHGSKFSGRNILPLLVADYMPQTKVFLYDKSLYSKEFLSWSGRDPDSTFIVSGYDPTMGATFKMACLGRPHVIYKGRSNAPLYIATPFSTYEREERVFLMRDALMDYLIPGSWGVSQHQ